MRVWWVSLGQGNELLIDEDLKKNNLIEKFVLQGGSKDRTRARSLEFGFSRLKYPNQVLQPARAVRAI